MTPEKLNYLLVLEEEQNMTRAASRLFITQPTLTAYINNLEHNLGVKLFDRSHHPICTTACGKLYIQKMQELVLAEQLLCEEIKKMSSEQLDLRIGIGQIHSELWCPDLVHLLLKRHPFLNIQIKESQEMLLMEMLKNDEIDVLFGHVKENSVNYRFEEVCEEHLLLVIPENLMPKIFLESLEKEEFEKNSPTHPFLIEPEILSSLPLIKPASSQGLYLNLNQIMQEYHIDPVRIIQTSNMVTAGSFIRKGLGYMFYAPVIFSRVTVSNPKKVYYCTLPRMFQTRKFYAVYKADNPNIKIIRDAIKVLKDTVIPDMHQAAPSP